MGGFWDFLVGKLIRIAVVKCETGKAYEKQSKRMSDGESSITSVNGSRCEVRNGAKTWRWEELTAFGVCQG